MDDPHNEAQELVDYVKAVMKRKDGLIYEINRGGNDDFDEDDPFEIKALRALSGGGVHLDVWVEVVVYNVGDPKMILEPYEAAEIGKRGGDIDTYDGTYRNNYAPSIEVHGRFSY